MLNSISPILASNPQILDVPGDNLVVPVSRANVDSFVANKVDKPIEKIVKNDVASRIIEFGRGLLETPRSIGPNLNIAPGLALGLRVEGSLHTKESPLVKDNPFRLAATIVLEKENKLHSVLWTQTGGILELGTGFNGTLPLGQFAGLQVGFIPSALLRYRCIKPHVLGFVERQSSKLNENETALPFSSLCAKNLPAGAEYELVGQGRLRLLAGLAANLGTPVNSFLNAGVGASAFVNYTEARQLSLRVLSLDGGNKVRVTVGQLSEDVAQLGAMAYAGIVAQIGPQFPSIGQGLLQGGSSLLSGSMADKMASYYTSLGVQATTSDKNSSTLVGTYDFDLSKPEACAAYDELMQLSCESAESLAGKKGSGVRSLAQAEKEHASLDEFSVSLFGDMLCLYQALQNEKEGELTSPDGKKTLFHKTQYKKHESGWFEPTRDITWESVTLQDATEKNPKTFFRFRFEKKGDMQGLEYNDYFGLANALSLSGKEASKHGHPYGPLDVECKRILCRTEDAAQLTDIYFTSKGIQHITDASLKEAESAYYDAIGSVRSEYDLSFMKTDEDLRAQLIPLIDSYIAENNSGWFLNFGRSKRIADLEAFYLKLCNRPIGIDAVTYSNAKTFARHVSTLKNINDPTELENFFVAIGKSKGFRYKCWIGALASLARDEETLVHKHQISGSGVVFKYNDEGKLEEPSEIITDLLSRVL